MPSFFDQSTYESLQSRLNNIAPNDTPKWGKMSAAQMLMHCQAPIKTALGKDETPMKSNWIVKLLFKRMMYSEKPFRKNAPTPPQFQVRDERDFKKEKQELSRWMQELYADRNNENTQPHPVFGIFTKDQWGILQWKHLDHHFRQFGV